MQSLFRCGHTAHQTTMKVEDCLGWDCPECDVPLSDYASWRVAFDAEQAQFHTGGHTYPGNLKD